MKSKGQQTKENILLVALYQFSKKGVQNVSFQDIAEDLGITQPALYKYFKNKNDLLKQAIELAADHGREYFKLPTKLLQSAKREQALLYYIKKNIEWSQQSAPYNVAFLSLHYFATQIEEIKTLHQQINEARQQRILELILPLISEKKWSPLLGTPELSRRIHNILLGEMLEAYNQSGNESIELRAEQIFLIIKNLLNAKD